MHSIGGIVMGLSKSLKIVFSFNITRLIWFILLISPFSMNVSAQVSTELGIGVGSPDNDNSPRDPDQLIDNIWWVGHSKVGAFLITTSEGHFLMDTTSTEEAHDVIENVVKAGFHLRDIKYIINTHSHAEHIGGLAAFQRLLPHAKIVTTRETAEMVASGDADEMGNPKFEPVKVDAFIADNEALTLGGETMVAHHTPGHTKGVTTWSMKVMDKGKEYDVVFMAGMGTPNDEGGPGLLNNELYPEIASDFEKSFKLLRSLPCDVFMTYRALSISLDAKVAKLKQGGNQVNPFVDSESCQAYIDLYENRYTKQLAEEKRAAGIR
jgi:metallo-beta-lactamase class B